MTKLVIAHDRASCGLRRDNTRRPMGLLVAAIALAATMLAAPARAELPPEWASNAWFEQLAAQRLAQSRQITRQRPQSRSAATSRRRSARGVQSARSNRSGQPARRRYASLGRLEAPSPPKSSITGGGAIRWAARSECLNSGLRSVIANVAANFGRVTVNSTCRSKTHNRRVGGASKSYHLTGNAADLRVHGNIAAAAAYLASVVGGFISYGGGLFHIDTGPRRPMARRRR